MKKVLIIAASAFVLSSANATTVRLEALGQDNVRGSFFIDDNYNVFRNAAYVNMYKNYVVTEWGAADTTPTNVDSENLEGGFFREAGSFSYGLYFNNDNALTEGYAHGSSSFVDQYFKNASNTLDLFIGGDMGIQWGAKIQYASSKDKMTETDSATGAAYDTEHSSLGFSLGMMMGDLSAYVNYGVNNEYTGSGGYDLNGDGDIADAGEAGDANSNEDVLDAGGDLNVGLNYKLGDMRVYVDYDKTGMEYTNGTDTSFKKEYDFSRIVVGAGHTHEISASARIFTQISYVSQTEETKASSTQTIEEKDTSIPLLVGFEVDANSWLTLRGHISQNLPVLDKDEYTDSETAANNDENVSAASTAFAAGATLNFGKLKVDGIVGGQSGNADELNTDTILSRVAVSYMF